MTDGKRKRIFTNSFHRFNHFIMSKIEWTERTWNFLIGCNKVSAGCKNCYAIRMAYRLMHNPKMQEKYSGVATKTAGGDLNWTGKINIDEERLLLPLQTKKPTTWFVNSMSDLFHEDVPFDVITQAFAIMAICYQHTFQILTKRVDRMQRYFDNKLLNEGIQSWARHYSARFGIEYKKTNIPLANVWLGVSVEDQKTADERIPLLLHIPAAVRWLSMEPLLGPVHINDYFFKGKIHHHPDNSKENSVLNAINALSKCVNPNLKSNIDWVVAGGESGPNARPMHPDWVRSIRDQCNAAGVSFFFKQWGEWMPCNEYESTIVIPGENAVHIKKVGKKKAGRLLDGKLHDEYPKKQFNINSIVTK